MTEPTNPLFEDPKDFLERRKLEYERALRGDVAEIKETTAQAGKVALIGAGVVGGIWLLTKAFSGSGSKSRKKKKKHRPEFEDYAGFDGFDANDREWSDLANDYQAPEYAYDPTADEGTTDGFYSSGAADEGANDDDNGLSEYPDFPAHSSTQHGPEGNTYLEENTYYFGDDREEKDNSGEGFRDSEGQADSHAELPYDDSRRLAHATGFDDESTEDEKPASTKKSTPKTSFIVPTLLSFAKSETGRVLMAQGAALALALVTKVVQDIIPQPKEETGKNADLAGSSAPAGVPPATWPATSAASDASAAAHHDDTLAPGEPLA